jgi:hypothetical protein
MTRTEKAERVLEMAVELGMLSATLATADEALGPMIAAREQLLAAESKLRTRDPLDLADRAERAQDYIDTLAGADAEWANAYMRYWRGIVGREPRVGRGDVERTLRRILRGDD